MRSLKERLAALERSARRPGSAAARGDAPTESAADEAVTTPGAGLHGATGEATVSAAGASTADSGAGTDVVPGGAAAVNVRDPLAQALVDLGFHLEPTPDGAVWVRTLRYDALTLHGTRRLGALLNVPHEPLARLLGIALDATDLRFYDTETTGLGTGAGTFAFLHAVGWLEEDEFVVEQLLVADYTAEAALLERLWERRFAPAGAVVSFNGKAFDWPLLRSRMALHRLRVEVDKPHLDLLHPARRLWKHRLERVTLQALEEAVLGLRRQGDLPGREAPDRYFRFVQSPAPELLEPVLAHNASDVLTLAVLAAEVAERLAHGRADTAAEYAALGRIYDEWQAYDLADRCFEQAVACPDADWRVQWLGSLHWKRQGAWDRAAAVWEEMAARYPWSVAPLVELAKLAEHRRKDLAAAEAWAEEALRRALWQARERMRTAAASGSGAAGPNVPGTGDSADGPAASGTGGAVAARTQISAAREDEAVRALQHRLARIRRKRAAASTDGAAELPL